MIAGIKNKEFFFVGEYFKTISCVFHFLENDQRKNSICLLSMNKKSKIRHILYILSKKFF